MDGSSLDTDSRYEQNLPILVLSLSILEHLVASLHRSNVPRMSDGRMNSVVCVCVCV